jgi:hypothetical protein
MTNDVFAETMENFVLPCGLSLKAKAVHQTPAAKI